MHRLKRILCVMAAALIIISGSGYAVHAGERIGAREVLEPAQAVYASVSESPAHHGYVVFSDRNQIKSMDMRQRTQVTEEQLREYLQRFPYLLGIEGALIEAQDRYNVNLIMMLAIIRLESGNGRSAIARNQNNLGGIRAPAGSVTAWRSFDSQRDSVMFIGRLLGQQYLTEGGRFFNGHTLPDINRLYAESSCWAGKVRDIMYEIQRRL